MEEIRKEESNLLARFNALVGRLQEQFGELQKPLIEFFEDHWEPQMIDEEEGSTDSSSDSK